MPQDLYKNPTDNGSEAKVSVAIVGAGLIGRAWSIVFARANYAVCLYDVSDEALMQARRAIQQSLQDLKHAGLVTDIERVIANIRFEADMASAMRDASYVQECGPENIDAKQNIYQQLEEVVDEQTILASSTSGIAGSAFTTHLNHPERCLVAHPVNPPYLIPLVEVVPTPHTSQAVVQQTMHLMKAVQQEPILVHKEIEGFVLNRLQGALLNEALRLFRDGYVSAEDIDKTVKHGLGLRWSFMGPFETIDLNAPEGIVDYAQRYGPLYHQVDLQRGQDNPWKASTLQALNRERRERLPIAEMSGRHAWRDRQLMALNVYQQKQQ